MKVGKQELQPQMGSEWVLVEGGRSGKVLNSCRNSSRLLPWLKMTWDWKFLNRSWNNPLCHITQSQNTSLHSVAKFLCSHGIWKHHWKPFLKAKFGDNLELQCWKRSCWTRLIFPVYLSQNVQESRFSLAPNTSMQTALALRYARYLDLSFFFKVNSCGWG